MERNTRTIAAGVVMVLFGTAASFGHHSFAGSGFDGSTAVHVTGTIVSIEWVNPHSWITVASSHAQDGTERWALEGPSGAQLKRMNVDLAAFREGDTLQACGYAMREERGVARSGASRAASRLLSAELLTLADGRALVWSNYGQRKCLDSQD